MAFASMRNRCISKTEEGIVWPSCKFSVAFCLTRLIATSKLPAKGNFHRDATNTPGYLDERLILEKKNIMRILFGLVACLAISLAGSNSVIASWVYDANAEFKAFELANASPSMSNFGNFSAGYSTTPGTFTGFLAVDHTNDFLRISANSNPIGALQGWGYPASSSFVPAVVVNTLDVQTSSISTIGAIDASQILMHGGSVGNAVLRFTATMAGTYSVSGDWESLDSGLTNNKILKNGMSLFSDVSDLSTFSLLNISMNVNDTIDFVVDSYSDGINGDSTGLRATITAVPEPTTLALFGLGGIGLAIAKRRRTRKVAS